MEHTRSTLQKVIVQALNRLPPEQVPLAAWEFVAGGTVSAKTRPLSFAEGVLTVEVPDTAWRTQLRDMAGQYVASLNQYSGQRIERVEFVLATQRRSEANAKTQDQK